MSFPRGLPVWVAQLSPDVAASARFYGELFGWSYENIAGEGTPPFLIATLGGRRVASLAQLPDPTAQDPATWIAALAVPDLDETTSLIGDAGGTARPEDDVEIDTLGHFHRTLDPAGTEIHIVEPLDSCRTPSDGEAGTWTTIVADLDPGAAGDFYATVFGWRNVPDSEDFVLTTPGATHQVADHGSPVIATMRHGTGTGDYWVPSFVVDDLEVSIGLARHLGGTANGTVVTDPTGATFAISAWSMSSDQ